MCKAGYFLCERQFCAKPVHHVRRRSKQRSTASANSDPSMSNVSDSAHMS